MNSASCSEVWIRLLQILTTSEFSKSVFINRNIETLEISPITQVINMEYPIIEIPERKISYPFMFAEAWWILSGKNDVGSIQKYAPSIDRFSNDGIFFDGAYGPRVVSQLTYVISKLVDDVYSRQAVMSIWTPNPRDSKDIPCTISLQFLVRENRLNCVATMRSSDAWIGFIYDVFTFSCISYYILVELRNLVNLDIQIGSLYLTSGSQHLYANEIDNAKNIADKYTTLEYPDRIHLKNQLNKQSFVKFNPKDFTSGKDIVDHLEVNKDRNSYQSDDIWLTLTENLTHE